MTEFNLFAASGANPGTLLPALLIATSVNEARPSPVVTITYENGPTLPGGDAALEFTGASGSPVQGLENTIKELRSTFPFLKGKNEELVSIVTSSREQLF
jgi:glutamyl-tRNA synthetase